MKYYELTATAYLKEDIAFDHAGQEIGSILNKAMLNVPEMKELHKKNIFKNYCFGSFFPIEKDKVYKKGSVYTFKIRSLSRNFATCVKKYIKSVQDTSMTILAVEASEKSHRYVSNVYSVTPVVVTLDENKRWTKDEDFSLVFDKLITNLKKKYNSFYEADLEVNNAAISRIELMNRKPMIVNYKNVRLLGNKFKIWFNEDEVSQKLAFIAMTCGLGEKNSSAGAGFCMGGQDG